MYVCMYVCMLLNLSSNPRIYVCVYVCKYVCMYWTQDRILSLTSFRVFFLWIRRVNKLKNYKSLNNKLDRN